MDCVFGKITSLADVEAIEKTPLTHHSLAQNTYAIFQRSAEKFGDSIALRFLFQGKPDEKSFTYSYRELLQRITQAANLFDHLGITHTDVVSLLLPNLPQYHFALWGAQAAGIANPINPQLSSEHIIEIMKATRTKVLVTLAPAPASSLWEKTIHLAEQVPSLETILIIDPGLFMGAEKSPAPTIPHLPIAHFDEQISLQPNELNFQRDIQAEDIACYFHTGGTTGTPKLAIQSHFNQVFSAWMVGKQLQWQENDVMHCGLPLFHVNAPLISGLAPFTVGGEVLLTSPLGFRSEAVITHFWTLVERYRISFFMAVPTVYLALHKKWNGDIDTSSLKFAACGAAPMPTALIKEFTERTHIRILEGYGLTEGTVFSCVNPPYGERRTGSVGIRIPYQQMKAVIVDENGDWVRDCQLNEIGTLVIKGPNVFQGYLQQQENQSIWAGPGWLNTGDLGTQDEAGYFWLTGRSKDVIIRGGHNIDPHIIEEVLAQHPAVAMAAAVGAPDPKMGEVPVAYVSLHEQITATEKELILFVKEQISEHVASPQSIYILPSLPLTAVGKIYKPALRADAMKRVIENALAHLQHEVMRMDVVISPHAQKGQLATIMLRDGCGAVADKILASLKLFKIEVEVVNR